MPRNISQTTRTALNAQTTDDGELFFLKIDDGISPLRFVNSGGSSTITSDGEVYQEAAFEPILPSQSTDPSNPGAEVQIDNIDQLVLLALESLDESPEITMHVARRLDPDDLIVPKITFTIVSAKWDLRRLIVRLSGPQLLEEPAVYLRFTPLDTPGLWEN